MGYGIAYKPRRINFKNCKGPVICPVKPIPKKGVPGNFSGNTYSSGIIATTVYQQSKQIQIATSTGAKGKLLRFGNRELNAFGSWNGAPNGSKCRPKNIF